MELTLRQQTKKWDVCFWLGYTKDINFTIDWDSGFTFKVSFIFFQFFVDYGDVVEDKLPKTSIDEELLYFANMLYATSKDDTKRVNSIVDGIHKVKHYIKQRIKNEDIPAINKGNSKNILYNLNNDL